VSDADTLLTYYNRELGFLRRMSERFAAEHPTLAGRLLLEPGKSEDPHVERLIESFALLAARIHLKIDDDFPEITEALPQILYPHYLAPTPSMSIVQFELDREQGRLSTGYRIDRDRRIYAKFKRETACRFRTCYPVTLWPIEVSSVQLNTDDPVDGSGRPAAAALTLTLRALGDATFSELAIDHLRFFLSGDAQLVSRLYEVVFNQCRRLELRRPGTARPVALPETAIGEVGFRSDEGMLPYSNRSFLGYRLVQEYFSFPEKFLFFDIRHLEPLRRAGFDREASIVLFLKAPPQLQQKPGPENFRLGCTPVINLFDQTAEPIRLDQTRSDYPVVPDLRRRRTTEVYQIETVSAVSSTGKVTEFEPFYSLRHSFTRQKQHTFWHGTRRPSTRADDPGTDVFLSLVDREFRPSLPPTDVVTVKALCTNRDLAGELEIGNPRGDFVLEEAGPVGRISALKKPTRTLRAPLRRGVQWRLISHLSLNFLSLVSGDNGEPEVLREILKLYDFSESSEIQEQIQGLVGISGQQVMRRIRTPQGSGFARGVEATLEFDDERFVGSCVYLFASVLEKFLGLYVSVNGFSETVARTRQRGLLKRWQLRSGEQTLL